MATHYSTGGLAEFLGTDIWRIRRLFEDGTLPDPPRIGLARAIPRESIPSIIDALRARGWLAEAAIGPPDCLPDDDSAEAPQNTPSTSLAAADIAAAVGTEAPHEH